MEILRGAECQANIARIVGQHADFVEKIKNNPFIKDVRQTGTILAIELATTENTSYTNTIKARAMQFFLDNGVLIRPLGNIIYILPPYCISQEQLQEVYDCVEKFLLEV